MTKLEKSLNDDFEKYKKNIDEKIKSYNYKRKQILIYGDARDFLEKFLILNDIESNDCRHYFIELRHRLTMYIASILVKKLEKVV